MDAKIQIRRLIELDLRAAVANDAIEVYFQPIVDVATGEISGFEALARWNHPVRGRVSPGEFIPIVEELGLMDEFGASVLRRACLACASWPDDVSVSVNLSPMQFRNGRVERDGSRGARRGQARRPSASTSKSPNPPCSTIAARPAGHVDGAAQARRPHLARRFRHRLFELELRAGLPARPHQDRPLVHHRPRPAGTRLDPRRKRRADVRQTRHERLGGGRRDRPANALHRTRSARSPRSRASISARPCRKWKRAGWSPKRSA